MPVPTPTTTIKSCESASINTLNASVFEVILHIKQIPAISYQAGQYLDLIINNEPFPFSIACSYQNSLMSQEQHIQLHIGVPDEDSAAFRIIQHLHKQQPFSLELPKGQCHIDDSSQAPLLIIAAGTGFSQAKALIEHSLQTNENRAIHLYWGVRDPTQFYQLDLLKQWAKAHSTLSIELAASDSTTPSFINELPLRKGNVHQLVMQDWQSLEHAHVYLCGSPAMVYNASDELTTKGLNMDTTQSDVFDYFPRAAYEQSLIADATGNSDKKEGKKGE